MDTLFILFWLINLKKKYEEEGSAVRIDKVTLRCLHPMILACKPKDSFLPAVDELKEDFFVCI
jgi:hypothetical protein